MLNEKQSRERALIYLLDYGRPFFLTLLVSPPPLAQPVPESGVVGVTATLPSVDSFVTFVRRFGSFSWTGEGTFEGPFQSVSSNSQPQASPRISSLFLLIRNPATESSGGRNRFDLDPRHVGYSPAQEISRYSPEVSS